MPSQPVQGIGPVAILCGGRGTRLQERTHAIPKALVEVGDRPILWHVIRIYAAQGLRRFLLLNGHLGEMIEEFVLATEWPEPVEIECLDTGSTPQRAGGSPWRASASRGSRSASPTPTGWPTWTSRPYSPFTAATATWARLPWSGPGPSSESPSWIRTTMSWGSRRSHASSTGSTAGSSASSRASSTTWTPTACWSAAPLRRLAAAGQLRAFRHTGFWDCMDTYKDAVMLNDLWGRGRAPWAVWERDATKAGAR